jgi:hypothetical protein
MTNDETQMSKEFANASMTNQALKHSAFFRHSALEISHFFGEDNWSFGAGEKGL